MLSIRRLSIDKPVSLPRQQSAMLPILNQNSLLSELPQTQRRHQRAEEAH